MGALIDDGTLYEKPDDAYQRVVRTYNADPQREWNRLDDAADHYHRLEFEVTEEYLNELMPPSGRVLDAGCGAGRYTQWLLARGYKTVALDLTPGHVAFVEDRFGGHPNLLEATEGSVLAMPYNDGEFDAVLCTGGVLSHLLAPDRVPALRELARVAKAGAPIFVSVIGRWGVFNTYALVEPAVLRDEPDYIRGLWETGEDHNWCRCGGYAHYYTVDEALALLAKANLPAERVVALEGLTTGAINDFNAYDRDSGEYRTWRAFLAATRELPVMADLSHHFLVVTRGKGHGEPSTVAQSTVDPL